jgi:predicted kinase
MEAIIFVGIQGAGKSSFYRERFFNSHIRINLDMLKTRYREALLVQACILAKQPFVVDNTNVLASERARYIEPAREAGFRVVGYFFPPDIRASIARNKKRTAREVIPVPGLLGTAKRLQEPQPGEGFDRLYIVRLTEANEFVIEEPEEPAHSGV